MRTGPKNLSKDQKIKKIKRSQREKRAIKKSRKVYLWVSGFYFALSLLDFTNKLLAVFLNNNFWSKVKVLLSYDKLAIKILFLLLRHTWTSTHIRLWCLLIYLLNLSFIIIIVAIILPKPFSSFSCQAMLARFLVWSLRCFCCCFYSSGQTSWFCDSI